MKKEVLLQAALFFLCCAGMYFCVTADRYNISNTSVLLGSIFSMVLSGFSERHLLKDMLLDMAIVFAGIWLGLNFWLWPLALLAFLSIRVHRGRKEKEQVPSCMIAMVIVENGIFLFFCGGLFLLLHLINWVIG